MPFQPERVFIERQALDYPLTRRVLDRLAPDIPVSVLDKAGRIPGAPQGSPREVYSAAKRIMAISLSPRQELRCCRPSADFELPLGASCPGLCQYCYLQSSFGLRPYVRVYADLDRIMASVRQRLAASPGGEVSFEGASTSDPIAVEHLTGALAELIPFFGGLDRAVFRVVTKFAHTESLVGLAHGGRTRIRYSLNTPHVVGSFEAGTDGVRDRIAAANRLGLDGYPVGFVLAPLMIYPGWEKDYDDLLRYLAEHLDGRLHSGLTFELISHRFTAKAKELITARFPQSRLDLDEARRRVRWGRYGRRKFVYPADDLRRLSDFLREGIARHFPGAEVEYSI